MQTHNSNIINAWQHKTEELFASYATLLVNFESRGLLSQTMIAYTSIAHAFWLPVDQNIYRSGGRLFFIGKRGEAVRKVIF